MDREDHDGYRYDPGDLHAAGTVLSSGHADISWNGLSQCSHSSGTSTQVPHGAQIPHAPGSPRSHSSHSGHWNLIVFGILHIIHPQQVHKVV